MEAMALQGLKLTDSVPRPDGGGANGKKILVITNCYSVTQYKKGLHAIRWHYDVTIKQVEKNEGRFAPIARQAGDRPLPPSLQQQLLEHGLAMAEKRGEAGLTVRHIAGYAFDGKKNIFTAIKFGFSEHIFIHEMAGRNGGDEKRYFSIQLKEVGKADPNIIDLFCKGDRQTIQAASASTVDGLSLALQSGEIALRTGPSKDANLKIHGAGGRRFVAFNPSTPIALGAEILKGFFQSLRPTQAGLVLNLDLAFGCFLQGGPLLEVAAKVLGIGGGGGGGGRGGFRGGSGRGGRGGGGGQQGYGGGGAAPARIERLALHEQQTLRKMLNGAQIKATHRPNAKLEKLTGFTVKSARETTFVVKGETRETSVVDYYKSKYNITLKNPNLPCALLNRKTMIPLELCEVASGNPIPLLRMKPAMVQDMIRHSALKPSARLIRNREIRQENAYERSELLKSFDMNVAAQPIEVTARALPPPQITYAQDKKLQANFGGWNLINVKFVASGDPLMTVVLLNFANVSERECRFFAETQLNTCKQLGMQINVGNMHYAAAQADPSRVNDAMREAGRAGYQLGGKRKPPQLYIIFLDDNAGNVYETIKRVAAAELASPVATQCVNIKKAFNRDPKKQGQYCANVAMKINIKMGGTNQAVKNLPKVGNDCMFIGADVTHAAPGSGMPSIIASVATTDGQRNRFNSELATQVNADSNRKAQEAILDGHAIYSRHLQAWMDKNSGRRPSSIIVFRDGVSEGEYQQVVNLEVDTLKMVCSRLYAGYNPKVTFIVCGKRHHVRFYAKDPRDVDRSENLPAGTVVDRGVVHPYAFDFYLQSQAGLVGTARPAHYQIVKDEIGFKSDELQMLLNNLTYSYARSTRSVSLPPMVMYAHFLAEKGRALIYGSGSGISDMASVVSGERSVNLSDMEKITKALQREPLMKGDTPFGRTLWYM